MANHPSAKKRSRQNTKRNARNTSLKARMRQYLKVAREAVASKAADRDGQVKTAVREVYKAQATTLIKPETASRLVSRLMKSASASA